MAEDQGRRDATRPRSAWRRPLGDNPAVQVQDKKDISEGIAQMITLMLNMLYGLLAHGRHRRRARRHQHPGHVGLRTRARRSACCARSAWTGAGVKRMVRLESLVISLFGGVLGIGLGVFFGWAVGELIGSSAGDLRTGPAVGPDGAVPRCWPRWSACWPRCGRPAARPGSTCWPRSRPSDATGWRPAGSRGPTGLRGTRVGRLCARPLSVAVERSVGQPRQSRVRSGSPDAPPRGVRTARTWLTPIRLCSNASAEAAM